MIHIIITVNSNGRCMIYIDKLNIQGMSDRDPCRFFKGSKCLKQGYSRTCEQHTSFITLKLIRSNVTTCVGTYYNKRYTCANSCTRVN